MTFLDKLERAERMATVERLSIEKWELLLDCAKDLIAVARAAETEQCRHSRGLPRECPVCKALAALQAKVEAQP